MKAEIIYVYHSCFILKTSKSLMIFDYYKDPATPQNQKVLDTIIHHKSSVDNILIFSSHSHGDHFNPEILTWKNYVSNIQYILSDDIKVKEESPNYHYLAEGNVLNINDIYIKAYGSSDLGVSFLVKVDELTLFHSGDLNWWHWPDDTPEEEAYAEKTFKDIVENIKEYESKIDVAFFPVDPRLETFYYPGGEYFAKTIKPKLLIPMHFWEDFNTTKEFKLLMDKIHTNSAVIHEVWQEINY